MKKFKEEDLILYIYKECPPSLQTAIEQAIQEDIELKDRVTILQRSIRQLDKLKLASPSKASIRAIIQHARQASAKK